MKNLPSVVDYLSTKGFKFIRRGSKDFTNSPFNSTDRTPSFCVFPDDRFKCFSSGKSGNVLTLIKHFGDTKNSLSSIQSLWVPPAPQPTRSWNGIPPRYLDITQAEREQVETYAKSRCISHGYLSGITFYHKSGQFVRSTPAMVFPHQNETGSITGAKFRFVEPVNEQRFTSRGKLGFFILEHLIESYETPDIWLIEGEINAISLYDYFVSLNKPAVILSVGGVGSVPKQIPTKYSGMFGRVLIDFDGSEKKYQERLELYRPLNLLPVKLILPKDSDINSLMCGGKINLIENFI